MFVKMSPTSMHSSLKLHLGHRSHAQPLKQIESHRFTAKLPTKYHRRHIVTVRASSDSDDDDAPPVLMDDWRAFRAKLVADQSTSSGTSAWSTRLVDANRQLLEQQNPQLAQEEFWAHAAAPEVGGILIGSSSVSQTVGQEFWQAIIFILEHGPEGSAGVILNRPTSLNLARLGRMFPDSVPEGMLTDFAPSRLYTGGFEAQRLVCVLHGHKQLKGTSKVLKFCRIISYAAVFSP